MSAQQDTATGAPAANDADGIARLQQRKEQAGLGHRADIKNFVDYIDADEKRS